MAAGLAAQAAELHHRHGGGKADGTPSVPLILAAHDTLFTSGTLGRFLHHDGFSTGGRRQAVTDFLVLITLVKIALLLFIVLTVNAYLTWFERKVVAHVVGTAPRRSARTPSAAADGAKFLLKEDPTPAGVDKFTSFPGAADGAGARVDVDRHHSLRPRSDPPQDGIVDLNIGILALFAITALSVYGVRWHAGPPTANILCLVDCAAPRGCVAPIGADHVGGGRALSGRPVSASATSSTPKQFIRSAASSAGTFSRRLLGFLCFFIAAIATNRVPFDLPEAESELVAGFRTEYASFKFAMFFIAEYTSMITVSSLCAIMFFGGWLSPFPASCTHYLPSRDPRFPSASGLSGTASATKRSSAASSCPESARSSR